MAKEQPKRYIIIEGAKGEEVESAVNHYLREGYVLAGPLVVSPAAEEEGTDYLYQPMIKKFKYRMP